MRRRALRCGVLIGALLVAGALMADDRPTGSEAPPALRLFGPSLPAEQFASLRLNIGEPFLAAETEDDEEPDGPKPGAFASHEPWGGDSAKFFLGAFTGFLGHECGHVLTNYALDTDPYFKGVEFSVIPFFTIQPGRELTKREHYITASAGFNAQHLINEWLLIEHPNLHHEKEPFLKGIAHFNFWLTVGYAASAFAGYGPDERDTKGMADSLGWSEESVAAMILVPTLLDAYRYKHPKSGWAKQASRISKLLMFGLLFEADQ